AARDKVCKKACEPAVALMERIAQGFDMVRSPARIALCLFLSFVVWGLLGLSWWIMAQGCPGVELSFFQLTAAMVIVCFFISLPSVPGFWGLWEAGGIFALSLFGVAASQAAGFTLVNHVLQTLPVMVMGGISAVIKGVNLWSLAGSREEAGEGDG
ncbi:MAG: lysylphosphatidylglycerol synthase transmembrane domain-containing protein, partial [Pseudomonadota bacterium]